MLLDSPILNDTEKGNIGLVCGAMTSFHLDIDAPEKAVQMANACLFVMLDVFRDDARKQGQETPADVRVSIPVPGADDVTATIVLRRDGTMTDIVGGESYHYSRLGVSMRDGPVSEAKTRDITAAKTAEVNAEGEDAKKGSGLSKERQRNKNRKLQVAQARLQQEGYF